MTAAICHPLLLIVIGGHELAHHVFVIEAIEIVPVILEYLYLYPFARGKDKLAMSLPD